MYQITQHRVSALLLIESIWIQNTRRLNHPAANIMIKPSGFAGLSGLESANGSFDA